MADALKDLISNAFVILDGQVCSNVKFSLFESSLFG